MIFADDIVLVAKFPEELESMLTDIHLASKPVGLSMNLSKTKVRLNENAITSTLALDENTIEKIDRYVYLGKTMTQAEDILPEIKRRIALGWAAFGKMANIIKSRKASLNVKRKVHNEYGAIQVLRNADGGGGVWFSGKKRYEGVMFNVSSVTRGWVGVQFSEK